MNLYHLIQIGAPMIELVAEREAVQKVRTFFANVLQKKGAYSAPAFSISAQAVSMIDSLLAPIFPSGPMSRPATVGSLPPLRDFLQATAGRGFDGPHTASHIGQSSAFDALAYTPQASRQASVERYLSAHLEEVTDPPISQSVMANIGVQSVPIEMPGGDDDRPFDTLASTQSLLSFMAGPISYHDTGRDASALVYDWATYTLGHAP